MTLTYVWQLVQAKQFFCEQTTSHSCNYLPISYSSTIVQDIQSFAKTGMTGLAYFYCDVSDDKKRNVTDILSSLIIQLLLWKPSNQSFLDKCYDDCMGGHSKPSDDKLYEVLRQLLSGFEKAYVLVDALDESRHMEEILEFTKVLHGWNLDECHLLVTSRKEQKIVEAMIPTAPIEIDLSQMPVDADIGEYIEFTLHSSSELKRWLPNERDLIKKVLLEKSNGM